MQERRIQVNGIALQIRQYPRKAPAILCLHFSGANLMMWLPAVPYFQERYHLLLVDLRGHGRSDRPESGYHMDVMAADVVRLLDRLALDRVHVVGSSLGAEVGLSLAAHHPDRVSALVCDGALASEFGPYSTWERTEAEFAAHVARRLEAMRQAPETVYPTAAALVAARRALFEEHVGWNEAMAAMERYGACQIEGGQVVAGFRPTARVGYMANYYQTRLEDYYRRVTCPLLMLPDADVLQSERETAVMEGLRDLAGQAEIAPLTDWDHPYGWLRDPQAACREIGRFLDRAAPAAVR